MGKRVAVKSEALAKLEEEAANRRDYNEDRWYSQCEAEGN